MATSTTLNRFPAHVPPELIWDDDIDRFIREMPDPYKAAVRLHDGPDIVWAAGGYRGVGGWLLTRYDDIEAAYLGGNRSRTDAPVDIGDSQSSRASDSSNASSSSTPR